MQNIQLRFSGAAPRLRFDPLLGLGLCCWLAAAPLAADDSAAFFESRIRPVLIRTCFTCHGGDKTASNLRVDGLQHLTAEGHYGRAVVPGKPHQSVLLAAIRYEHSDLKMPPKERLPERVVRDFEKWIADGAVWPETQPPAATGTGMHWAFQPVQRSLQPPEESTFSHPIDRFLDPAQQQLGLNLLGPASRQALLRRAAFDLTGLPPSPADVHAFLADRNPNAFLRAIDRMLESPQYAERWARHWLDLVRYADTAGDDSDYPIPQAARYRDYVIDSFAADKSYDRFLQEQIAGDILADGCSDEEFRERTIATGFLAQAKRFATGKHEDMHLIVEDTLQTIGQAVLGLTVRCARCHDHKYDPLTQQDYYALYGFFQSTVYPHPGGESDPRPSDLIPLVGREEFSRAEADFQARFGARIAELEAEIKEIEAQTPDRRQRRKRVAPVRDKLRQIHSQSPWKTTPLAYAVKEGQPTDAAVQVGGEPRRKGPIVPRGIPQFLGDGRPLEITPGQSGRLELARWLTSADNPLTARVMVNRIWQYHFGRGIVSSPSNFGIQGDSPTHPQLLDWLATQFMDSGWSVKAMHRLIMSSAAYQRESGHDGDSAERDPENQFYWRFDRRRLDAESIRDSMLWLAGNLDLCRPGPHPFPAAHTWRFSAHRQFKAVYPSHHRSIYLMVQRLHPHPFLSLFNGPSTTASIAVRDTATLPLQALFMSNSAFVHAQAEGLARRLLAGDDKRLSALLDRAHWLVFSRPVERAELHRGQQFLRQYSQVLADEGLPQEEIPLAAWAGLARTLFASNEFVYID